MAQFNRIEGFYINSQGLIERRATLDLVVAKDGKSAKAAPHDIPAGFDEDINYHAELWGDGNCYICVTDAPATQYFVVHKSDLARIGLTPRLCGTAIYTKNIINS